MNPNKITQLTEFLRVQKRIGTIKCKTETAYNDFIDTLNQIDIAAQPLENEQLATPMQQLKAKLQDVVNEDATTGFEHGYKKAMQNVIADIDAQMLTTEADYIKATKPTTAGKIDEAKTIILQMAVGLAEDRISTEIDEWDLPKTTPIKTKRIIIEAAENWNEKQRRRAIALKNAWDMLNIKATKGDGWISVEDKPLYTKDANGNWICTEEGDTEFIAAVPYKDKFDQEHWWIHHCVVEDRIGLCVVGDGDNEKAGWELEDVTHYQPITKPLPPTPNNNKI